MRRSLLKKRGVAWLPRLAKLSFEPGECKATNCPLLTGTGLCKCSVCSVVIWYALELESAENDCLWQIVNWWISVSGKEPASSKTRSCSSCTAGVLRVLTNLTAEMTPSRSTGKELTISGAAHVPWIGKGCSCRERCQCSAEVWLFEDRKAMGLTKAKKDRGRQANAAKTPQARRKACSPNTICKPLVWLKSFRATAAAVRWAWVGEI